MPVYVEVYSKDECLSEGGGCHVEVIDAALAAVTSGDLVIYHELVGVALGDYRADTTSVVLDLCGGHVLGVVANDGAGSAVNVGDWLYYNRPLNRIDKDRSEGPPIGQALEAIASGEYDTICVVIRPVPPAYP